MSKLKIQMVSLSANPQHGAQAEWKTLLRLLKPQVLGWHVEPDQTEGRPRWPQEVRDFGHYLQLARLASGAWTKVSVRLTANSASRGLRGQFTTAVRSARICISISQASTSVI